MLNVPRVNSMVMTNPEAKPDIIKACASIMSKTMGSGMKVPMKEIKARLMKLTGTPISFSKLHTWLRKAPRNPASNISGTVRMQI